MKSSFRTKTKVALPPDIQGTAGFAFRPSANHLPTMLPGLYLLRLRQTARNKTRTLAVVARTKKY